jgi:UDP-N-acetyl-D-glucosamine dehydrogenase
MKVAIIGQGYVGLTIALFAAEKNDVIGFDNRGDVIDRLNNGISHIEGVSSEDLKSAISAGKYKATTDPTDLNQSEIIIIAVPTPLDEARKPDLSFIESACKSIGENVDHPVLVINESTSFPGTVRNVIKPLIEKYSKTEIEHRYAVSPERVDPGRTDWNQRNTPRLYAGLTTESTKETKDFYSTFCDNLIEVSSPEVAESAKLFENTFRQVNIALVNEFAEIAHALGISVHETLQAAATKPYGFMQFQPSAGVGGHCIPVDPSYLSFAAMEKGVKATFIERANEVNLRMPKYIVDRVERDNGGSLKNKSVQIVGVAYKPDVADVRETPAELIYQELKKRGAEVSWHDPLVSAWNGGTSAELGISEIGILVTPHSKLPLATINSSFKYLFDCSGKVSGAKTL